MPQRFEDPAFAEGREEVVHLPGGCTISGKQYAELQTFMEAPSIDKWWVYWVRGRVGVAGKGREWLGKEVGLDACVKIRERRRKGRELEMEVGGKKRTRQR